MGAEMLNSKHTSNLPAEFQKEKEIISPIKW